MARPYILITETILLEIESLHSKGVPVSKLIRDYHLKIASPTLQRLITHVTLYKACDEKAPLKKIIHKSLFPAWLEGVCHGEVTQPPEYYYKGLMPLGEWLKR